jgi:BirA family transcriptional regulator, biotin operon repressor / biotin---[acetyl-CoA-carboxylase] ligase
VVRSGGFWRTVIVTAQTGSTHDDLLAAAKGTAAGSGAAEGTGAGSAPAEGPGAGSGAAEGTGAGSAPAEGPGAGSRAAEGTVLVAEAQSAGRGRLGRSWVSPPRAALTFSVLLRPAQVPVSRRGWVPLLAGVAIVTALRAEAAVDAWLKWPNDVLVKGAKLAGILAEQSGDAIVVGAGINVSTARDELPADPATSLALEGAGTTDRGQLLTVILAELERQYQAWVQASGDADASGLRESYQRQCATLGQRVRVSLPGGTTVAGTAREIDQTGRLVVQSAAGLVRLSAGDVVHVR